MGAVRMFLIAVAAMSAACAIADAGPSASKSQDGGKLSLGAINRVERNWNRGWRFRTEGDAKAAAEYEVPFKSACQFKGDDRESLARRRRWAGVRRRGGSAARSIADP